MPKKRKYNEHKKDRCEACGHNGSQYFLTVDHFKTRGSGGTDNPENCITLCLKCHGEKGSMDRVLFSEKYPNVKKWLIKNGWELCPIRNKWFLPL